MRNAASEGPALENWKDAKGRHDIFAANIPVSGTHAELDGVVLSLLTQLSQAVFFSAHYNFVRNGTFFGILLPYPPIPLTPTAILIFRGSPPLGCIWPKKSFLITTYETACNLAHPYA
jgi:hypothetical protein